MNWQPIETAPKDQVILVYNPYDGVYSTKHERGEWPLVRTWASIGIRPGSVWMELIECADKTETRVGIWFPVPTHWMPLPSPPNEQDAVVAGEEQVRAQRANSTLDPSAGQLWTEETKP